MARLARGNCLDGFHKPVVMFSFVSKLKYSNFALKKKVYRPFWSVASLVPGPWLSLVGFTYQLTGSQLQIPPFYCVEMDVGPVTISLYQLPLTFIRTGKGRELVGRKNVRTGSLVSTAIFYNVTNTRGSCLWQ